MTLPENGECIGFGIKALTQDEWKEKEVEEMNIKEELKDFMEKNNVSYVEMMQELSLIGEQLVKDGTGYMNDTESQAYKKFKETGNDELKLALIGASWTHTFALGVQTIKAMFDDVNFSEPFRVTVDYDPEQPRVIIRKYLTKEAHESYMTSIQEKLKD